MKSRHLCVLRQRRQKFLDWARPHVWQHSAQENPDRTELVDGKWYYTDETLAEAYGPFNSVVEAALALQDYVVRLSVREVAVRVH